MCRASSRTTKTMWLAPPVSSADQLGEVDARHGVGGTVHDADTAQLPQSIRPGGRVGQAGRLSLRQRRGRRRPSRPCGRRRRRSSPCGRCRAGSSPRSVSILKLTGLPAVDADVGREALDGAVARAGDVPLARRIAGLLVLADDRVAVGRSARVRGLGAHADMPWREQGESDSQGTRETCRGDTAGRRWRVRRRGSSIQGDPVFLWRSTRAAEACRSTQPQPSQDDRQSSSPRAGARKV